MTVGATFTIGGRPVLVVDLMVSATGVTGQHDPLPTHHNPALILPTEFRQLVAGLARKTIQIGSSTLICASGRVSEISKLFRSLRAQLSDVTASIPKIEKVFVSTVAHSSDMQICGWSIDPDSGDLAQFKLPRNDTADENDFRVIGSGTNEFSKFYSELVSQGIIDAEQVNLRAQALQVAGRFIGEQQFFGFGIRSLFGGGIEVFVHDGTKFELIDNVCFLSFLLTRIMDKR